MSSKWTSSSCKTCKTPRQRSNTCSSRVWRKWATRRSTLKLWTGLCRRKERVSSQPESLLTEKRVMQVKKELERGEVHQILRTMKEKRLKKREKLRNLRGNDGLKRNYIRWRKDMKCMLFLAYHAFNDIFNYYFILHSHKIILLISSSN